MAASGPAPRPALQVVREGNPAHKRRPNAGLKVPPAELLEPDWEQVFPRVTVGPKPVDAGDLDGRMAWARRKVAAREASRARLVARREWRRVVPVLKVTAGLGAVDASIIQDLCVVVARLDQAERDITLNGIWVPGERGAQKNPCVTAAGQYRVQFKAYVGELGLSPSSRTRLTPADGDGDDADDAFD